MSRLDDFEPAQIAAVVVAVLIAIVAIWFFLSQNRRCEQKGGRLVYASVGWTCIKQVEP